MCPPRLDFNGWSPDIKLWKALERTAENLIWGSCIALDPNARHRIPIYSGVYVISAEPPFKSKVAFKPSAVLYAGQSKTDLRSRFITHCKDPSPSLKQFIQCFYPNVHFWYARIDEKSQIDKIEALLIETFNPPCNSIRAPGASTIIANIGTSIVLGQKK